MLGAQGRNTADASAAAGKAFGALRNRRIKSQKPRTSRPIQKAISSATCHIEGSSGGAGTVGCAIETGGNPHGISRPGCHPGSQSPGSAMRDGCTWWPLGAGKASDDTRPLGAPGSNLGAAGNAYCAAHDGSAPTCAAMMRRSAPLSVSSNKPLTTLTVRFGSESDTRESPAPGSGGKL